MVRSADASPCRQRDDTFASASPSSPAGGSPPTSTPPTIAPAPMAHREDATAAALWTRRMRGAGEQPDAGAPSSAPTSTEW